MANERDDLIRLSWAMAEEISELPDEEVLELARLGGLSADSARQVQGQADAALSSSRRSKLLAARADLDHSKSQGVLSPDVIDLATKRKRLDRAFANANDSHGKITLAARDGKSIPDEDVCALYDDAVSLGMIADEGTND